MTPPSNSYGQDYPEYFIGVFTDDRTDKPLYDWQCHLLCRDRPNQVQLHQEQSAAGDQRGLQEDQVPLRGTRHWRDSLLCPRS